MEHRPFRAHLALERFTVEAVTLFERELLPQGTPHAEGPGCYWFSLSQAQSAKQ